MKGVRRRKRERAGHRREDSVLKAGGGMAGERLVEVRERKRVLALHVERDGGFVRQDSPSDVVHVR